MARVVSVGSDSAVGKKLLDFANVSKRLKISERLRILIALRRVPFFPFSHCPPLTFLLDC